MQQFAHVDAWLHRIPHGRIKYDHRCIALKQLQVDLQAAPASERLLGMGDQLPASPQLAVRWRNRYRIQPAPVAVIARHHGAHHLTNHFTGRHSDKKKAVMHGQFFINHQPRLVVRRVVPERSTPHIHYLVAVNSVVKRNDVQEGHERQQAWLKIRTVQQLFFKAVQHAALCLRGIRCHHPMTTRLRRIAHLDMDAFFASIELLRYPQLKGLPVVIGGGRRKVDDALLAARPGQEARALRFIPVADFPLLKDYVGRGVITTATYAARQFGVGSAMGMMKAAKLCPQAIVLPVDFDEVRKYSRLFKSTITEIAPLMEDRGVDEVYVDFTDEPGGQRAGGRVLARLIQRAIFEATGLTCSVGVAPNKLLAKMASEFNKPSGISVVYEADLQTQIWPLKCRKINGIGPKADEKLARLSIQTIGELAAQEKAFLVANFGKATGAWMHEVAWGRDDRPVVTESEPVSMSRETTFDRDLHAVRDKTALSVIFTELCSKLGEDLQRKGYAAKTIGIKLRYDDFKIATRDQTGVAFTANGSLIRYLAGQCLKRVPLDKKLRLLGVRASGLVKAADLEKMQNSEQKRPLRQQIPGRGAIEKVANTDDISGQLF